MAGKGKGVELQEQENDLEIIEVSTIAFDSEL